MKTTERGEPTTITRHGKPVAVDLPNGWRAGPVISLTGRLFFKMRDRAITAVVDVS